MAKPGEYTRTRYAAMQGVMWLVLAGAVGLASLVDRSINPAARNPSLGAEQSALGVLYRLPTGWSIYIDPVHVPGATAIAIEPEDRATQYSPRNIIVYCRQIRQIVPPADYLQNVGLLDTIFRNEDVEAADATMDGNRAIEIDAPVRVPTDAGIAIESDIVICSVFTNHIAVAVQLRRPGYLNAADRALFEKVVRAIRVDR